MIRQTDVAARHRRRLRQSPRALQTVGLAIGAAAVLAAVVAVASLPIRCENWMESEQRERIERRARMTPEERQQEQVAAQFSAWDGSHRKLVEAVKKRMHNPRSFEHVETRYGVVGDELVVTMEFRGTNAFGGVVRNTAAGRFGLDGSTREIVVP
jgi:hypothetical protein